MSLTMTRTEGVTVFTITSNPKSKCPLIFLLLRNICCRHICFVSRNLKQQLGTTYPVLGALQILVGIMNVGFGCIIKSFDMHSMVFEACISLGGLFIAAGIICILVGKFPSQFMVGFTVVMNLTSAALALTSIGLYIAELTWMPFAYHCDENCDDTLEMMQRGLEIIMIVLGVLQFCVTVSWSVLSMQALYEKKKGVMMDPEFHKPLLVDVITTPAC